VSDPVIPAKAGGERLWRRTTPGPRVRGDDEIEATRPSRILPVIIVSQFAGTSLWFAGNAVLPDLPSEWGLTPAALGHVTSAVQLGFIIGTLAFAFLTIADRYSPRKVFFVCSLAGAAANLGVAHIAQGYTSLLALRFATGFFLAGIYPVGMRIAAAWYQRGLGHAIGLLVGALAVGTALPHLLRGLGHALPWQDVTLAICVIAAAGGVLMLVCVPDGPYLAKSPRFDPRALRVIFRSPSFRASAFGYFGHMWELYPFWAFVPVALTAHAAARHETLNVPLSAFAVIAIGFVGCALGGLVSLRVGSARVAFAQLAASGLCCIVSPWMFAAPTPAFVAFLLFWGIVVIGDSPQFSALNAQNAPRELVGSALTIANCIGFSITIAGLQFLNAIAARVDPAWLFAPLVIGPLLGLAALRPLVRNRAPDA
jgi:predicted MFS family arabinose efflux permease